MIPVQCNADIDLIVSSITNQIIKCIPQFDEYREVFDPLARNYLNITIFAHDRFKLHHSLADDLIHAIAIESTICDRYSAILWSQSSPEYSWDRTCFKYIRNRRITDIIEILKYLPTIDYRYSKYDLRY